MSESDLKTIAIAGWHSTGPIVAAAGALAGEAIDRAAIDTQRFRFGQLLDYRDPMFLPGGAKYLDLPGLIALNAPRPLWLAGEGQEPAIDHRRVSRRFPGRWTGDLHRRGRSNRKPRPASGC